MADTIRDVIIRIGIQQQNAKLVVPDYSATVKAAEDASTRIQAEFAKIKSSPAVGNVELPAIAAMDAVLKKSEEVRASYQVLFAEIRDGFQAATNAATAAKSAAAQTASAPAVPAAYTSSAIPKPSGGSRPRNGSMPTREGIEEAKRGLAEIDAVYEHLRQETNNFATDLDKIGAAEIESIRATMAEEIRIQEQRLNIHEAAAAKFKEIQKSERLAVVERVKDQEEVMKTAQERFKKIAASERLAAYKRGQEEERVKEIENAAKRVEAARRKEAAAEQARQAKINTSVEAIRSSGEGVFRAWRGAALVFSDTSDGLEKLMNNIRYAQGAWDIFSGSAQLAKGAMRAFSVVQIAATAAGGYYALALNLIAVAQTRLTAAVVVSTNAVRGFVALIGGPVVATAVAAVAIWGAATYAMGGFSKQATETSSDLGNLVSQAKLLTGALHEMQDVDLHLKLADELAKIREQIPYEEKILGLMDRQGDVQKAILDIQKQDIPKKLQNNDDKVAIQAGLGLLKLQEDLQKRNLGIEKDIAQAHREQQAELQKNLEKQQQILATAKMAAEQERGRVESLQEAVGRLTEVERIELKNLIDKKNSGQELTRSETERLGQIGGSVGQDVLRSLNIKEGSPLAELLNKAFKGQALTGPGSQLGNLDAAVSKQTGLIEQQRKELEKRSEEIGKLISASLDRQGEMAERLYKQILTAIEALERRQQNMERESHQKSVANFPTK